MTEAEIEVLKFLMRIFKKCDKIAVMENSKFNSQKTLICEYKKIFPSKAKIKNDDIYLYSLYKIFQKEENVMIITTDEPLIGEMKKENLKISKRDEFLIRLRISSCF